MKETTKTLIVVILLGIAALVWITLSVLDFVFDTPGDVVRILHIICAIIWCVAFVVWVIRWRGSRQA